MVYFTMHFTMYLNQLDHCWITGHMVRKVMELNPKVDLPRTAHDQSF